MPYMHLSLGPFTSHAHEWCVLVVSCGSDTSQGSVDVSKLSAQGRSLQSYNTGWSTMLDSLGRCISSVIQSDVIDGSASITAHDVTLHVGEEGCLDVRPLLDVWPQMREDWEYLSEAQHHQLLALQPERVPIVMLLRFVELRRRAGQIPQTHPIHILRQATLAVIVFFLEASIACDLDEDVDQSQRPPTLELFGQGGRTRAHHRPLSAMAMLEQCRAVHGSKETICRSLGGFKGTSAQLRAAKLRLYGSDLQTMFEPACAVHMSLDGSCHGGKNMLVTEMHDPDALSGGYAKPEAAMIIKWRSRALGSW